MLYARSINHEESTMRPETKRADVFTPFPPTRGIINFSRRRRFSICGAEYDGVRAAMKNLNDAKGMDACIASLKAHGVNRISDLSKEKIAGFIEYVREQITAKRVDHL
jgi:hypothetical protein